LIAQVSAGGAEWEIDLDHPVTLAIETRFVESGFAEPGFPTTGPTAFGAPRASSQPLVVSGFNGSVAAGASCNCRTITLTPHCNATHVECVGHLTAQPFDVIRVVPPGLVPAALLTIAPELAGDDDLPITASLLKSRWRQLESPRQSPPLSSSLSPSASPRAVVIRTLPNEESKRHRDYTCGAAPYLTPDAARWLVEHGIEHLIVDTPSIDRMADGGRLAAHRTFFGLPPGATDLALAARPHCTITELAYVPDSVADGEYLLQLQVPALAGDAVPARPLLYAAVHTGRRSGHEQRRGGGEQDRGDHERGGGRQEDRRDGDEGRGEREQDRGGRDVAS